MNPKDQLAARLPPHRIENFDTSETIHLSPLALLKMLKHARSEIPIEITGILLGRFVDDFTIDVLDVFGTPQKGDTFEEKLGPDEIPFQQKMIEFLKKTEQRGEIVGWYHSHPGKGLLLSAVAVNYQMNLEKKEPRSIAMVVDPAVAVNYQTNREKKEPIVKYYVSIGAFRCIDFVSAAQGEEPREITSFNGYLGKPTTKQLVRGLNKQYYQLQVSYKIKPSEQKLLESLHGGFWETPLKPSISFEENDKNCLKSIKNLIQNAREYKQQILEEEGMSYEDRMKRNFGRIDPCDFIKQETDKITIAQINQLFVIEVDSITF